MMDKFLQILRRLPMVEESPSSGHSTPFKDWYIKVNFDIPLF
jgi:hypothetical protein